MITMKIRIRAICLFTIKSNRSPQQYFPEIEHSHCHFIIYESYKKSNSF